jgi:hypothetical protein
MQKWASLLLLMLSVQIASASENMTFYDWQADFQASEKSTTCFIQLTGINRERFILLTMNLSALVEKSPLNQIREITVLRVTASQINKPDLSDMAPIKIHNAWIKTSLGTSLGKITKIDVGPELYYLGGAKGSDLFHTLIEGILNNGAIIGYQEKPTDPDIVSRVPAPPPDVVIGRLLPCLANVLPDMDKSI